VFIGSEQVSPQQKLIEQLQTDLAHERDARKGDQFFFVMALVILLDVIFFETLAGASAGALVILQALILIVLARRMGIEEIQTLVTRFMDRLADRFRSNQ